MHDCARGVVNKGRWVILTRIDKSCAMPTGPRVEPGGCLVLAVSRRTLFQKRPQAFLAVLACIGLAK